MTSFLVIISYGEGGGVDMDTSPMILRSLKIIVRRMSGPACSDFGGFGKYVVSKEQSNVRHVVCAAVSASSMSMSSCVDSISAQSQAYFQRYAVCVRGAVTW